MKSEKQNYKIPLVQLELWSRSEGRLTDLGFELLEIGKNLVQIVKDLLTNWLI